MMRKWIERVALSVITAGYILAAAANLHAESTEVTSDKGNKVKIEADDTIKGSDPAFLYLYPPPPKDGPPKKVKITITPTAGSGWAAPSPSPTPAEKDFKGESGEKLDIAVHFKTLACDHDGDPDDEEDVKAGVKLPEIKTETVATTPSDRTRTTIGVGEVVNLSIEPTTLGSVNWELDGDSDDKGKLDPSQGPTSVFTAKDVAGEIKIKIMKDGEEIAKKTMTIVVPTGEKGKKLFNLTTPSGKTGAGMRIEVTVQPTNVSFANVEWKEEAVAASNTTGYFRDHPQSHPESTNPTQLDKDNKWIDEAGGYLSQTITVDSTLDWDIPVTWRVKTNGMQPHTNALRHLQHFSVSSSNEWQVTKFDCTAP